MHRSGFRIGWLSGLAAAAIVAPHALAQQTAPVITPSPSPTPGRLPGVIPERFSIAPPTPTPSVVPVTIPTPAATPTPAARATPAPRREAPARASQAPRATPTPAAETAAPATVATPAPVTMATPTPAPVATAAPAPAESATAPWFWVLLGAGATALAGAGAWLVLRRRNADEEQEEQDGEALEAPPAPAPRAAPPPSAAPVAPPPGLAPRRTATEDPFDIVLNPLRIQLDEREALLEFELLIGNLSGAAAENIRVALAAISANPQQDAWITGFHRGPPGNPAGQPFDLAAGGGGRVPVRLALPRERIHVVTVGNRPMFVPMVLVDLRWRAGLGIRRFGTAFMLGTAGQGGKLGPVWLDRAAPAGPLAATRYVAKDAVAA